MTQSQVKINTALFCDLKTDEEKSTFFLSGRGYETGVVAQAIQNDVAMAYHRCSEYRKEMEALQVECENLRKDAERYRWLCDGNGYFLEHEMLCGSGNEKAQADAAIDAAMQGEQVSAQVRYRRPEKGQPGWSDWQPAAVMLDRPSWEIDSQGWEVEYRLLYTAPQPAEQQPAPDVAELVGVLEDARTDLLEWMSSHPDDLHDPTIEIIARIDAALAAHRKQEPSHDNQ